MKALKATLKKISKKKNPYSTSAGIYNNGEDNGYSDRIQAYKDNSVTALSVSDLMAKYILGRGFGELDKKIVNQDGKTMLEVATDASEDISDFKGFWVHITFNANLKATNFKVFPFSTCKAGLKDSKDYNGKIVYRDDWHDGNKKNTEVIYDAYTTNEKVRAERIKAAGGADKYKGEVAFFTMQPRLIYPLARLHAVANDADTEAEISNYKNIIVHDGFLGKMAVVTPPMIKDDIEEEAGDPDTLNLSDDVEVVTKEARREKANLKSESESFAKTLNEFGGVNGQSTILHIELDYSGDDIEKAIKFEKIETNINPDFFKEIEATCKDNIASAYGNCPQVLIKNPETAFFSGSGEQLLQARLMYQDNTEKDRNFFKNAINELWKLHQDYDNKTYDVIPLVEKPKTVVENGSTVN